MANSDGKNMVLSDDCSSEGTKCLFIASRIEFRRIIVLVFLCHRRCRRRRRHGNHHLLSFSSVGIFYLSARNFRANFFYFLPLERVPHSPNGGRGGRRTGRQVCQVASFHVLRRFDLLFVYHVEVASTKSALGTWTELV